MGEILNGKYLKLQNEPIGEGSQAKVYLYEAISEKKNYFNRKVSLLFFSNISYYLLKEWLLKSVRKLSQKKNCKLWKNTMGNFWLNYWTCFLLRCHSLLHFIFTSTTIYYLCV